MTCTATHLLSLAVLCLSLAAVVNTAGQSQQAQLVPDSAPSALAHLLRRRSAELEAPPSYYASRLSSYLRPSPSKRDDGYWIWMPAHGYMSVPKDVVAVNSGDKDSMGNLLRYGRK